MSEQEKQANDRRNVKTPPFTFRFANRRMKAAVERMANRNHRTIAGEINAIIEAATTNRKEAK